MSVRQTIYSMINDLFSEIKMVFVISLSVQEKQQQDLPIANIDMYDYDSYSWYVCLYNERGECK